MKVVELSTYQKRKVCGHIQSWSISSTRESHNAQKHAEPASLHFSFPAITALGIIITTVTLRISSEQQVLLYLWVGWMDHIHINSCAMHAIIYSLHAAVATLATSLYFLQWPIKSFRKQWLIYQCQYVLLVKYAVNEFIINEVEVG